MGGGLLAIWSVQIGYRIIQSVVFATTWKRGRWQGIEV
jgi:hypothetical protein